LPGVLVKDGPLGGISSAISAHDILILRGYDVPVAIFEDNRLSNEVALLSYLKNAYKENSKSCPSQYVLTLVIILLWLF
jgi:hypothetical protein